MSDASSTHAGEENLQKWKLSRRRLLQMMGAAGVATVASPFLPKIPGAWAASESAGDGAPRRLRQWAMVIDMDRCDGCIGLGVPPQCSQYCNWGRVVPEGMQWMEVYEERGFTAMGAERQFFPAPCNQCENAPCCNVCPVGACFHTPEGVVLVDQKRCIGCRLCVTACPYDRHFFNWGEPTQPLEMKSAPYDVQTQIPAIRGTVMKCDFCTERLAVGGLPYCVEGCPNSAIYMGDLEEDIASNGKEVVVLSRLLAERNAYRYKEELGTRPRVFFLPGHGDSTRHTSHEPFLKDKLEWPWREVVKQQEEQMALARAMEQNRRSEA